MLRGLSRWWTAVAGLGGCLQILLVKSAGEVSYSPRHDVYGYDRHLGDESSLISLVPTAATVLALCLLRWWPCLLAAGSLLAVPLAGHPTAAGPWTVALHVSLTAAFPLLVVGVLGAVQGLSRDAPGLGAAVAGLAAGAVLFGGALAGEPPSTASPATFVWRVAMLVAGLAGIAAALRSWRRGDAAADAPGAGVWQRLRLVIGAGAAVLLISPLSVRPIGRLGYWLGVESSTFARYPLARIAIIGAVVLVLGTGLAALAGKWPLAGAATVVVVQIGASTPLMLAFAALRPEPSARWLGALAGVAIGAAAAASRWRVAMAAALTVSAATALFIMYEAAGGRPEKMVQQHRVVPALVLLVLVCAAATAVVAATAPVLAPRGAVPAVLGPFAAVLTLAGTYTTQVSFVRGRTPVEFTLHPVPHTVVAGYLLLAAAAAIAALGVAHHMTERWAERKQAELIRREAAAAERDRLARPIHDGVLQVLALVQREGAGLGGRGAQLAALAAEQEAALRNLLNSGGAPTGSASETNLQAALTALSSPSVEVSAPATPVVLPAGTVAEITAAVQAAVDNVRQHAGAGARTWILLEDESDGVRVTVRDDGVGFDPRRLGEAARAGRLGVAQSMRGRISDLGGRTTIHSRPGEGAEVEFWVPRRRR
ncbi:ATP-binding protein [Actinoplanes sp. NEAU-A12]|uniref:ATP-binding protein n=1 Tax=Actinoplanes sandaracinus TaxID=3045177 RepID=A0ABT6WM66_9ACTN|nr:ATP-binding protein [Actinoplanes sandaracinus]MDI6100828.1 ATP-binding protein [Actinoplanes sandaracinus]